MAGVSGPVGGGRKGGAGSAPSGEEKDKKGGAHLGGYVMTDTVKLVAESVGVGALHEDALQLLADDATYRLKQVIQESVKVMTHGKRARLSSTDFDQALKVLAVEPLLGFHASEYIPFRHASGGGREIHFVDDREIDLSEVILGALPKVPLEVSLRPHWLAIDGVQPAVPENPPPVPRDLLRLEGADPTGKAATTTGSGKVKPKMATEFGGSGGKGRTGKAKIVEKVRLKEVTAHELSTEQQLYYREVTEACVGADETRRQEALSSLATDTGMHQMLPRFSTFIAEGVKVNVVQNNLALIIYLVRMAKSLIDNPTVYLEKYLHELIPALLSCIVSKQLCLRPDVDNHWALRDFASRLLKELCRMFGSSTNNIQVRITRTLSAALNSDAAPLATHYGAIVALGELGSEAVRAFIVPRVRAEADRLQFVAESAAGNVTDRTAAEHVRGALLKILPPVLRSLRDTPDSLEEYRAEYGYLGAPLHAAVLKLRATAGASPGGATTGGLTSRFAAPGLPSAGRTGSFGGTMILGGGGGTRPVQTLTLTRMAAPAGGSIPPPVRPQVVVMQQQRPMTVFSSSAVFSSSGGSIFSTGGGGVSTAQQPQPTVVKLVGAGGSLGPPTPSRLVFVPSAGRQSEAGFEGGSGEGQQGGPQPEDYINDL